MKQYYCFSKVVGWVWFSLAILVLVVAGAVEVASAQEVSEIRSKVGLSMEAPSSGPFVKVDGGFMVPYKATIPGTDVIFGVLGKVDGKLPEEMKKVWEDEK